jgi:hypothetical protein
MNDLNAATLTHRRFRGALLTFAFALACQAIWILAAEIYRPAPTAFPADGQAAAAEAVNRDAATLAASIGAIRGDLWAECALTYLDLFWNDSPTSDSSQVSETIKRARDVTERALTLSPHDARTWLVQATINSRFDWLNQRTAGALRMSYYTGANQIELIPLRLSLAVRSDAMGDKDFQRLVSHDIRIIVSRKPELKPVILAAYRDALPGGQQLIEKTLEEMDPTLLATLRPGG